MLLPLAPHERILVALDVDSADDALSLARRLVGRIGGVKVGLELVHAAGFDIFARLRDIGADRIFYDAKFHDIPNTVHGAVRAAAKRGVWMVNVHASGGSAMLRAAREAASAMDSPPLLIAVTVLTSIDQAILARDLRVPGTVAEQVIHLARLAEECGADGVVASPQELPLLRERCRPDFVTVIPGIRPAGTSADDQKRIATPGQAVRDGADFLVVGRAITGAPDPVAAAEAILAEIRRASEG
ncbi:MAG: orotidine-5'-phosphate decarboxylase [Capsulimonadales bacterium]|nr:orotidine-5'-phosphate decarboxylase [Capsulimonadales bacterium]